MCCKWEMFRPAALCCIVQDLSSQAPCILLLRSTGDGNSLCFQAFA